MAELITLARPYARAAFENAEAHNALAQWSEMLKLSAVVSADPSMQELIQNPALTSARKAEVFISVCEDRLDENGKNFIKVLAENHRLTLIPQVTEIFELLKRQKEKSIDVSVISAFDVTEEQKHKLATVLAERLGRTVNMMTSIDKSLIGGMVIRAEDQVIDASVRGKLKKLVETINS